MKRFIQTVGLSVFVLWLWHGGMGFAAEHRIALVIGNSAYKIAPPLPNPANDARLMAKTLRGLGFEVIERIEAHQAAASYARVAANIQGKTEEEVAAKVLDRPETAGLHGPTVARVYAPDGQTWFSVTVYVRRSDLSAVVDHFRSIGGASVTVSSADYVFGAESAAYAALLRELGLG